MMKLSNNSKTTCKMKCKDCTIWACIRRRDGEQQCYYEEKKTAYEDVYWYRFRAEAAKDILCHLLDRYTGDSDNKGFVEQSIGIADELIRQLEGKEE